ncbi:MAG: shikimate dehydrogenase family protein [Brevundimonas sp.]|uniref:shikimate dehydrogenase family protein n=1 Tax=Brevundimonas sp. TaxID=1871086 RepID=UPI00391D0D1B
MILSASDGALEEKLARVTGPLAAVIGCPIAHSLSPAIHGYWLKNAGIDGAYLAIEVEDEAGLERIMDLIRAGILIGVNVTAPLKEQAFARADAVSDSARAAGAANLLLARQGRLEVDCLDGEGIMAAIAQQAPDQGALDPCLILGAGGAARAAAAALVERGVADIRIASRTLERSRTLAAAFGAQAYGWDELERATCGVRLLIDATGAETRPPLESLAKGAVVLDMRYRPLQTALLAHAKAMGLRPVDGLAMLIGQARPSFCRLFGREPLGDPRPVALAAMERQP